VTVRTCEHGVVVGKFCAKCTPNKVPYCYSREEVIALNPIRKAQGLPPLREGDRYD